jgi:hypothetical protein
VSYLSNMLITLLLAFSMYASYTAGHYRGIMTNVDVATKQAARDAWFQGFDAGEDWANNKHRSNCNDT